MAIPAILGQIAAPIAGAAMGQIFGKGNSREEFERTKELQDRQNSFNEQASWRQYELEMKKWNETNYEAQVDHMKEAGLNVGMMYGGGASGGQTSSSVGSGNSVGMGNAPSGAAQTANQIQGAMLAAQTAQSVANIELTKAQTEKTKAETGAVPTTIEKTQAETSSLLQGIENAKVQQELTAAQTKLTSINANIADQSMEDVLDRIEAESSTATQQMYSAMSQAKIDVNTVNSKIKIYNQEATNKALEAVAIKSGIQLNKAKIEEISAGIAQKWKEININDTKSRYEHNDRQKAIEEYCKNQLAVAGIHAAGQVVSDVVKIATRQLPKGSTTSTRTERWNGEGNHTGGSQTTTINTPMP